MSEMTQTAEAAALRRPDLSEARLRRRYAAERPAREQTELLLDALGTAGEL